MGDSLCPQCRRLLQRQADRPQQGQVRRGAAVRCRSCGRRLGSSPSPGVAGLVVVLTVGALFAAASADLIDGLARLVARPPAFPGLLGGMTPRPDPQLAPLRLLGQGLLNQLETADQNWIPTRTSLPDGGMRYEYRRRPGEPELSLAQIEALMANPPRHERERQAIRRLLGALQAVGVQIAWQIPLKPGAAAEWDHADRLIRIDPQIQDKGTVDFLRVLTHESIHVAQSCSAGGLWAPPQLLGLPADLSVELETSISESLQATAPGWEQQLEREAYANQHRVDLGSQLLQRHCRSRNAGTPSGISGFWRALGLPSQGR